MTPDPEPPSENPAPSRVRGLALVILKYLVGTVVILLILGMLIPLFLPAGRVSAERNALASLKTLASAEADFRANDRDLNGVNDFWTGDVAGLYTIRGHDDRLIKLIELSIAGADRAPLPGGAAGGRLTDLMSVTDRGPKFGYSYGVMTHFGERESRELYQMDTKGNFRMGPVHHLSRYAFYAYPEEYGGKRKRTFIIDESLTVRGRDNQGKPVFEWALDPTFERDWQVAK